MHKFTLLLKKESRSIIGRVFYGLLYPGITFPDFFSIWKHSVGWGEGQTRI